MGHILLQIILIDAVFSLDSILTAVGMTSGIDGALWIMIIAVVVSILVMMIFAHPVTRFVHKHPSLQILALSFLIISPNFLVNFYYITIFLFWLAAYISIHSLVDYLRTYFKFIGDEDS